MAKKVNFTKNENKEVKRFIISLVIVIVLIGLIYLFTGLFVTKDLKKTDKETNTKIDYELTLLGNIFDINDDEYYVIIYDFKNNNDAIDNLITKYKTSDNYKKIYKANLSDALNKKYISNESNNNPTSINDLKIKGLTLIHFKNKKIISYIENLDEIKSELIK